MKKSMFLHVLAYVSLVAVSNAFISPTQNNYITSHHSFKPRHAHKSHFKASIISNLDNDTSKIQEDQEEVDVVVIGSGFGGLSCAALTSKYNLETICLEAHDTPGGVAHSFSRYNNKSTTNGNQKVPFRFDSGPSLISGLSSKSTNPLRQVLDAVNTAESIDWITYDGWIIHDYADGKSFKLTTGVSGLFEQAIEEKAGKDARAEFEYFSKEMLAPNGLTEVSGYIPPFALRGDIGAVRSLFNYLWKFIRIGTKGALLTGPFTVTMDKYNIQNEFVRKWYDYLAFALSGLDAAHTQAAPVAYTIGDLHREGCILDYPKGGMDTLIEALVKGITNHGGELRLNSRVEKLLLVEKDGDAHCEGVILNNGKVIKTRKGVVCNAPLWNMAKILKDSCEDDAPSCIESAVSLVQEQANDMEMTGAFMHLHLGIPKAGLEDLNLELHYSVLNFDLDVTAEQNLVIISIPTVVDPSLAPEGYHIIHAYTAASENFSDWESFLENNKDPGKVGANPNLKIASKYNEAEGYNQLKDEKAEALWKAIETVIPDVRARAKEDGAVSIVGTPLTHRRYNQRFRGTYGPAPPEGKDVWELPGPITPIKGLLACGDTTFPGIGLPGVAASGTIAANTLVSVDKQLELMSELKSKSALQ
mmetsp:Transcript_20572/g.23843  ORF Transcript_20572/g.23843 Transcript_20572/m.23843 type:complete len:644 (+) Transcript_20572:1776-3707(+)